MSILPGANNITITGGNFTVAPTTVVGPGPQKDIVAILHSHSATAGLLDAKERFDAPKCDEGTRISMIRGMKQFVQHGDGDSLAALYWLHGPAGIGKSALAQSLSLSLKDEGNHAASFFFSRTSPGRNNGNQLIVTLAYQLAMNFPALQPFMSKVARINPGIFTASNAVQMKSLIVDPVNKWRKKYNRSLRRLMDKLNDVKPYPRLILVDGLDECNDPIVQTDLIRCIAFGVRQLLIPLRFVIASRPESHILAMFELDPIFQSRGGVKVTKKNLGDDEDADEQITNFLLKEFAEIRRTHPIRNFLPRQWPRPDQIGQLVFKSSKGFIYPTTVIRYIKMPHNRPHECLDRILGLLEIPTSDKPYERLDSLYRYIFESVPEANKTSIHDIFHFLVIPSTWKGATDPTTVERHFGYPPGHVQHVLRDLLCILDFTSNGHIKILHASLPDFLLDKSRSGLLCIDVGDAHATIAAGYLLDISSKNELPSWGFVADFTNILDHLMQANMSNTLLRYRISQINLLACYAGVRDGEDIVEYATGEPNVKFHFHLLDRDASMRQMRTSNDIECIGFITAYLLVLLRHHGPENYIREQIAVVEAYVFQLYPAVRDVRVMDEQIIPVMGRFFRYLKSQKDIKRIVACEIPSFQNNLREDILELHFLMMAQYCRRLVEPLSNGKYHNTKVHRTEHPKQYSRTARGLYFWANIVTGMDKSFN